MKQVAPLRYDVIFKKAFSDPQIFTALVKDFLDIDFEIDQVESEKIFNPPIGSVETRFDLFAEDKKNRIIVEMQHRHYPDAYDRFLYYQCSALIESIKTSKNYRFPFRVITLVFFTGKKTPSPGDNVLVHDFKVRNLKDKVIKSIYGQKHQLFFVFSNSAGITTPKKPNEWIRAIDDSLDEQVNDEEYTNPQIHRLFDLIEKDQITPKERARMKDEYNQLSSDKTVFQDGEEKGKAEGMIEGERKGKAEGMIEGERKGKAEGMIETAKNLKKLATLTDKQISTATGLSLDDVQAL